MIQKETLTRNGSIDTLLALSDGITLTIEEAADIMGVSESTARNRLRTLQEQEVVEIDADLRDGKAVKTFTITDEGEDVAAALKEILVDENGDAYSV